MPALQQFIELGRRSHLHSGQNRRVKKDTHTHTLNAWTTFISFGIQSAYTVCVCVCCFPFHTRFTCCACATPVFFSFSLTADSPFSCFVFVVLHFIRCVVRSTWKVVVHSQFHASPVRMLTLLCYKQLNPAIRVCSLYRKNSSTVHSTLSINVSAESSEIRDYKKLSTIPTRIPQPSKPIEKDKVGKPLTSFQLFCWGKKKKKTIETISPMALVISVFIFLLLLHF